MGRIFIFSVILSPALMLSNISEIVKIAPDAKDDPCVSRIFTREHFKQFVFLMYIAFTVSSIALSLHGFPIF